MMFSWSRWLLGKDPGAQDHAQCADPDTRPQPRQAPFATPSTIGAPPRLRYPRGPGPRDPVRGLSNPRRSSGPRTERCAPHWSLGSWSGPRTQESCSPRSPRSARRLPAAPFTPLAVAALSWMRNPSRPPTPTSPSSPSAFSRRKAACAARRRSTPGSLRFRRPAPRGVCRCRAALPLPPRPRSGARPPPPPPLPPVPPRQRSSARALPGRRRASPRPSACAGAGTSWPCRPRHCGR
mmetsp:Transcript_98538/g.257460  ORF Transcript_98538/g.257460 Transcript_98538/m.257460 type:complete len:237 (-) Transcript_98538:274-984(-)